MGGTVLLMVELWQSRKGIGRARSQFKQWKKELSSSNTSSPACSELYRLLHPVPIEGIVLSLAQLEENRKDISTYLTHLQFVKLHLNGSHLKQMGFTPGPRFTEVLQYVHEAKLDGLVHSLEDEQELARQWFSRNQL